MSATSDPVRIFVGTDRSQLLAVKVLEHSIRRHTALPIEVVPMLDLPLPEPRDVRQRQRTGFSFSRFAIPRLAGYRGRALYLDADMLVLRDIAELWALPFDGAKVVIQEEVPDEHRRMRRVGQTRRIRQCSVMLLDCEHLEVDGDGRHFQAIIVSKAGPAMRSQLLSACLVQRIAVGEPAASRLAMAITCFCAASTSARFRRPWSPSSATR